MLKSASIVKFPRKGRKTRPQEVCFDRRELAEIMNIYGRMVAAGVWRDYAIAVRPDRAIFAAFRRASEVPDYRIVKEPARARQQGAFLVLSRDGQVMKRGHSLPQVLRPFMAKLLKVVN
jgi:hypothetical protein